MVGLERLKNELHEWIKSFNHLLLVLRSFDQDFLVFESLFETLKTKGGQKSSANFSSFLVVNSLVSLLPVHFNLKVHISLLLLSLFMDDRLNYCTVVTLFFLVIYFDLSRKLDSAVNDGIYEEKELGAILSFVLHQ